MLGILGVATLVVSIVSAVVAAAAAATSIGLSVTQGQKAEDANEKATLDAENREEIAQRKSLKLARRSQLRTLQQAGKAGWAERVKQEETVFRTSQIQRQLNDSETTLASRPETNYGTPEYDA